MSLRNLLSILICTFLLIGCSADVSKEIVGEWRGITPKQDLAFYSDGQVRMSSPRHSSYEGYYRIDDGDQLTAEFANMSRPVKCTVKISGSEMTLVFSGGRKEEYVRK